MHITRHSFNKEIVENNVILNDKNINLYLKELSNNHLVIRGLERLSLENLCYSASLQYPVDKQLFYLDLFIDASLAKYQIATNIGKSIEINLTGTKHQILPEDVDYSVSEQNWITGYMAALARRKMQIVHAFCAIDLDFVNQKKRTKGGAYSLLFAKFLQRLFVKGEPHGQNLLAAANEIKKDKMPEPTYEYALFIDGPVIDMFTPIFMNDEKDFNETLLSALELYKKYWSKEQMNIPNGLISLPITALTVMAKDYDLNIKHTSDYLLQYLIDN
ncbi:immunity 49 family protein [Pedobacter panaciterrae]|uniref:immunity 49 family protein n=1 Tax=Pedobacter panaciterrae TaxID=363849 RepID=UPI00155DB55A|nr:immunity 49 family protein [Pedobacter panaciterrae]NQX56179.1 immunity 49 family protein [Pedobacter panaciterrae]